MNRHLFILLVSLFSFLQPKLYAQKAVIKFVVKDNKTSQPIENATVKEGNKVVGKTDDTGEAFVKDKSKGEEYTFIIIRDDYEPADRSVFVRNDTTTTSPPVKLHSLNDLRNDLKMELQKDNIDRNKIIELKQRIEYSYDANSQYAEKKEFQKKYLAWTKNSESM